MLPRVRGVGRSGGLTAIVYKVIYVVLVLTGRTMRYLAAALLTISLTSVAEARPKHWFTDPKWYLGEFFVAASIGADAASTVQRTNRQIEGNRFLGRNPSRQKVIGVAVLSMGLQTTYHALAWHLTVGEDDTKPWRVVAYTAVPIICMSIYGPAAVHNYHLEFPKATFSPHMEPSLMAVTSK